MKPFTFFNKKYALWITFLFNTKVSKSQTVLGIYLLGAQGFTSWIIDTITENTIFSNQVDDCSYKLNVSGRIFSSNYLNTSSIHQLTKTSSNNSIGFKYRAYIMLLSDDQPAYFIGST